MSNIFEVATRMKLRFPYKGNISVEDLWDLPRTSLDTIYKTLTAQSKAGKNEESLMVSTTKSKDEEELDTKIEIVKYIFNIKTQEANAKLEEKERKEKKQKLMSVLAAKEDEKIQNMSTEEIRKMLAELE